MRDRGDIFARRNGSIPDDSSLVIDMPEDRAHRLVLDFGSINLLDCGRKKRSCPGSCDECFTARQFARRRETR